MLVDINLLERHERKNNLFYILLSIIVVLMLLLAGAIYFFTTVLNNEIENTESQIQQLKEQSAELQGEMSGSKVAELEDLLSTVTFLRTYPLDSTAFITSTTELLPEEGYVESYQYNGESVSLSVLLEDDLEAAYYLHHLENEAWARSVRLTGVNENDEKSVQPYTAQYEIRIDQKALKGDEAGDTE
ncbi:PilN domain-containing protein [Salinibacillus xinjiangensis]|uniref:Fimbrial protein n=1 Tax=Salinibacillus xinjiangensis TaxID=1229268 RepID=A0A6G1X979_9BACI|nr:PilN domain-containing protein [Salinibacillus xinjiangensis]MRG87497.1 hypothetical protein [Salinibacillus xinjiangensis]